LPADEVAGGFWQRRGQGIPKEELAKGTLRALIREAGLTVEEFTLLLWGRRHGPTGPVIEPVNPARFWKNWSGTPIIVHEGPQLGRFANPPF
jgi:hypothetical protein